MFIVLNSSFSQKVSIFQPLFRTVWKARRVLFMCRWETEVDPVKSTLKVLNRNRQVWFSPIQISSPFGFFCFYFLIFNGGNKNTPKSNNFGKTYLLFLILYHSSGLTLASPLCFLAGSLKTSFLTTVLFKRIPTVYLVGKRDRSYKLP